MSQIEEIMDDDAIDCPEDQRPLYPWFGSKRTMADEIVAELGKHTQYFEPFCGSMAVLLAKQEVSQETVNHSTIETTEGEE